MNRSRTTIAIAAVLLALALTLGTFSLVVRTDPGSSPLAHLDVPTDASLPPLDHSTRPPPDEAVDGKDSAGALAAEASKPVPSVNAGSTGSANAPDETESTASAPTTDAPHLPLEHLLRVPEAAEFPQPESSPSAWADSSERVEGPTRNGNGVRIDAKRRSDTLEEDPTQKREEVDAGASVGINDSTRIRGGFRIERDPDSDVTPTKEVETAPMIGVEKRF